MKKMLNEVIVNEESLLDSKSYKRITLGVHKAKVLDYSEKAVTFNSETKRYIAVTMTFDETVHTDKWFAGRINWVMSDLISQFELFDKNISLRSLLEYCKKHEFTIVVSEDEAYGFQINYAPVEAEPEPEKQ